MSWSERFTADQKPEPAQIAQNIAHPCYEELVSFIEETYRISPQIEYSKCSMARGWNVKYKKGNRSLCTIYPEVGSFCCMVVIGRKEEEETRTVLPACTEYVRELYQNTQPMNGGRWMMIEVSNQEILKDVKKLLQLRVPPKK